MENNIVNTDTAIKDSGAMREFETGAHRDIATGKGNLNLVPMEIAKNFFREDSVFRALCQYKITKDVGKLYDALDLFAEKRCGVEYSKEAMLQEKARILLDVSKHYEAGAKKYGADNWKLGIPEEVYFDSATRHYLKWFCGVQDEPHDRAFVWNIFGLLWTIENKTENLTD